MTRSNRLRNRQPGFSTVEILLTLLVALVLASVGWLIYRNGHKVTVKSTVPSSSSQNGLQQIANSNPTQKPVTKYLVLQEWGVKLPLPESAKDAYYAVDKSS